MSANFKLLPLWLCFALVSLGALAAPPQVLYYRIPFPDEALTQQDRSECFESNAVFSIGVALLEPPLSGVDAMKADVTVPPVPVMSLYKHCAMFVDAVARGDKDGYRQLLCADTPSLDGTTDPYGWEASYKIYVRPNATCTLYGHTVINSLTYCLVAVHQETGREAYLLRAFQQDTDYCYAPEHKFRKEPEQFLVAFMVHHYSASPFDKAAHTENPLAGVAPARLLRVPLPGCTNVPKGWPVPSVQFETCRFEELGEKKAAIVATMTAFRDLLPTLPTLGDEIDAEKGRQIVEPFKPYMTPSSLAFFIGQYDSTFEEFMTRTGGMRNPGDYLNYVENLHKSMDFSDALVLCFEPEYLVIPKVKSIDDSEWDARSPSQARHPYWRFRYHEGRMLLSGISDQWSMNLFNHELFWKAALPMLDGSQK
jgi:hypothetical protein